MLLLGSSGSGFCFPSSERFHFVYLDVDQLQWLGDVLKVAFSNSWQLLTTCSSKSRRRLVSLSDFWKGGVRFLRTEERCRDGEIFFVLIPMDWNSIGSKLLMDAIQGFLFSFKTSDKRVGSPPLVRRLASSTVIVAERSFASVAGLSIFPRSGGCLMALEGGCRTINVKESGVANRRQFLSRCLAFRLDAELSVLPDWKGFCKCVAKHWGVSEGCQILPLDDEMWLLVYVSKDEVDWIIRLGRWNFLGHSLLGDVWTLNAGISSFVASGVVLDSGVGHPSSPSVDLEEIAETIFSGEVEKEVPATAVSPSECGEVSPGLGLADVIQVPVEVVARVSMKGVGETDQLVMLTDEGCVQSAGAEGVSLPRAEGLVVGIEETREESGVIVDISCSSLDLGGPVSGGPDVGPQRFDVLLHDRPGCAFVQSADQAIWAKWSIDYVPHGGIASFPFAGTFLCSPPAISISEDVSHDVAGSPPTGFERGDNYSIKEVQTLFDSLVEEPIPVADADASIGPLALTVVDILDLKMQGSSERARQVVYETAALVLAREKKFKA
ncbi:hypothetical protein LINGRAPRIM_LOCUS2777 [Linum grandiflorum]